MSKSFSISEAQTLLPVLEALLRRAQASAVKAGELESDMQNLNQRIFLAGGMHVDIVAAARRRAEHDNAVQAAKDSLAEIDSIGVQVQSLEDGSLDFPCQIGTETVLLCWKIGEPVIAHWHGLADEFETRRPLDSRFGRNDRERYN